MKDAAISLGFGLAAIVMVYLSVWIFHFLYLTPKHLVEDAVVKKDAALKEFDLEKASLRAQLAELEQKLQRQRREAVKEVVDKAIRIIEKNPVLRKYPLRALLEAGVGDLETEDQFLEACEAIIQHRIHDPLMGLRDLWPNHPPKWLAAIKLANQKQVDVSQ